MRHGDLDRGAATAACGGEVAVRRVAEEDRVGEGIGVAGDTLVGVDESARTRLLASRVESANVGQMVELGARRARAVGAAVDQDVAAAILLIDLMLARACRAVVAEKSATGIAGAVAAINVPGECGRRRLIALRVRADIQPAAPFRHAVIGELVAGNAERVSEQVERAAMCGVGLGPRIAVDEVVLDGDLVLVGEVVEEHGSAAAATVLGEHIALDGARDVVQRDACAGERVVGACIVVDEVVGDVETLRLVEVAEDGLRVAGDLEAVYCRELTDRSGVLDTQERPALADRLAHKFRRVADLEVLAALEAAGEREIFLARGERLGVAALGDADDRPRLRGLDRVGNFVERIARRSVAALARGVDIQGAARNRRRARNLHGARHALSDVLGDGPSGQ